MKNNYILFYSVFITYIAWGCFWLGMCIYPIGEECVSAQWMLLFTGFPMSLLATPVKEIFPALVISMLLGAVQWAGLVVLVNKWWASRRKSIAS